MRLLFAHVSVFSAFILCSRLSLAFDATYTISTAAGSDWVGEYVPATQGVLIQAEGIATDNSGNIYVADASTHRIRMITPAGVVHTIAGNGVAGFSGDGGPASSAQLNSPYGMAFDGSNLYIADLGNARVRKIAADGTITTVAGGGSLTAGGVNEGSLATQVSLSSPRNVAFDLSRNLYISDFTAHRVYKMTPDGSLITFAGTGAQGYSGDGGAAVTAQLAYPTALACDRQGAMYIADSSNHMIRKVVNGVISSIARSALPTGLTFDGAGTLYVADRAAAQILKFPVSGAATALNISARDVSFGIDGYLYAADGTVIRKIASTGDATVIAGPGNLAQGDGVQATQARLNHPSGVAVDAAGNFYIADHDNNLIRRVAPSGIITTILSGLNGPTSIIAGVDGNFYIADTGNHRVLMMTAAGASAIVASGIAAPVCAIVDSNGNLFVADSSTGSLFKISKGISTTLFSGLQSPRGLALDANGNLYFTETGAKRVWMLAPSGDHSSLATGLWSAPQGITISAAGDIFVADSGLQRIVHLNANSQAEMIAGTASAGFAGDGGPALAAQFSGPSDVSVDSSGNLYVADTGNNRIRELSVSSSSGLPPGSILIVSAVNAASLAPGPIAPGMMLALENTGLGATDVPQTQVLFNNFSAAILSIDPTQVLVRVPVELAGAQSVVITINHSGSAIAQITANVADAAPGLFADATGQASALNQDGTLNSIANPEQRGGIISLFGTGEGVAGLPISVTIGGYNADILYAGPVPMYPGMFLINAQVPSGYFAGGVMPVIVTVGSATSQAGVTVAVN